MLIHAFKMNLIPCKDEDQEEPSDQFPIKTTLHPVKINICEIILQQLLPVLPLCLTQIKYAFYILKP